MSKKKGKKVILPEDYDLCVVCGTTSVAVTIGTRSTCDACNAAVHNPRQSIDYLDRMYRQAKADIEMLVKQKFPPPVIDNRIQAAHRLYLRLIYALGVN